MNISNILSRKNRILLAELVRTDFKLRYQASALGYVWSVLNPLLLFTILYLVFDKFLGLGRGIEHYPVYLLTGIVLWRFFTEATNNGLKVIVSRGSLIRKINFPKYILVLSGTVSSLINLGINLLVVLVFILVNQVEISWGALMIIPLIVELYIFALALAFLLAAVNVKLRDVGYIWDVLLQAMFYAIPIIYPLQRVLNKHEHIGQALLFNPIAQVIQDVRYFVINPRDTVTIWSFDLPVLLKLVPFLVIAATVAFSVWYFRRNQGSFAENI